MASVCFDSLSLLLFCHFLISPPLALLLYSRSALPKSVGQLKAEVKEGLAELFLEFKPNVNDGPFLDSTLEDENTVGVKQMDLFSDFRHGVYGDKRRQTLGQVTAYAAYMMQHQYQTVITRTNPECCSNSYSGYRTLASSNVGTICPTRMQILRRKRNFTG